MRSDILVVLLAAVASARPVASPDSKSNSVEVRELQYAEIEAMYIERDRNKARHHHAGGRGPHEEDAWLLVDDGRYPHDDEDHHHHHGGDGPFHGHHEFEGEFDHPHGHHRGDGHHHGPGPNSHEFEEFGHPHDHHHGGPHNDIVDNILGFLTHQVRRSVPSPSGRVMEGIRDFLSHETRDVHEHEHHDHPRGPSPGHDIGRHILDFFASATR